ncbi:MAG: outer membrane beta-barrel protein, partial [Pseudomonadota bacterium]
MKKVLLTAAAVSVLATSSAYAMEDMFYVKANVGWSKLNKVDGAKSKNDVHFGVGAGYHVMDNFRVDLTFDHYVNPTHKYDGVISGQKVISGKIKSDINSLLLNGFVDIYNVDAIKIFVGAGIGASQLKAKVENSGPAVDLGIAKKSFKIKQEYKFAFAGYVGAGYEFTDGVTGELSYSYRNLGKLGKDGKNSDDNPFEIRGHHMTAGVRFDI